MNKPQSWLSRIGQWLKPNTTDRGDAPQAEEIQYTHATQVEKGQYIHAANEETEYIFNRIQSISGLWEDLCHATQEGKPHCLSRVNKIASQAGIIEKNLSIIEIARQASDSQDSQTEALDRTGQFQSFIICSAHHEAAAELKLSSQDSWHFLTIIWALEGQLFKR